MVETTRKIDQDAGESHGGWGAFSGSDVVSGVSATYVWQSTPATITASPPLIQINGISAIYVWQATQGTIDYDLQGDGSKVKVHIMLPRTRYYEYEGFTAHVQFRNGRESATPDTVRYRVDCIETREVLKDWTTVTAASKVWIPIDGALHAPKIGGRTEERKQLTVEANDGTATAHVDRVIYRLRNIRQIEAA